MVQGSNSKEGCVVEHVRSTCMPQYVVLWAGNQAAAIRMWCPGVGPAASLGALFWQQWLVTMHVLVLLFL